MLFFTVSIAVMHEGEPIVGVIFEPATDSMYTAVKGADAQLAGRRITASEEAMDRFASVGLESHFEGGAPPWACELMTRTRFRNLGTTALQLAYVAKGSMVATIANTPKLWDIAAGVVINEAAGSVITNWQGENIFPVDLDSYDGHKYQVVVANKKVHPEVIGLLNQ
jgi:myo-inositol-1(or 4)-monophosphatase